MESAGKQTASDFDSESKSQDSILIDLRDVTKHYPNGDVLALDGIQLSIPRGQRVAVVGPSGCGKSTLLNMIGALDRPTSGEVWLNGVRLDEAVDLDRIRSQQIGFVFQSFHLLPNLTSLENIQLPMFGDTRGPGEREQAARDLLNRVGLTERQRHLPHQLSNGQRQRVAIARALANSPSLLLADEPTGALDSESGAAVMELLTQVCIDTRSTLVIVTHDDRVADQADRIVRLVDGRIVP